MRSLRISSSTRPGGPRLERRACIAYYALTGHTYVDLDQISSTTSLPIRRLRYVLEHRVLPGAERRSRGHRVTRHFTPFEAFGIACAAALLDVGLRRPVVTSIVRWLTSHTPQGIPLLSAFEGR